METIQTTGMSYTYRDGDNYKFRKSILVSGDLSFEDLKPYLNDSEGFIPSDVDLPSAHPVDKYSYNEESDHPWHEIHEGNFETRTGGAKTQVSKKDLIEAFRQASEKGWPGQYSFEGW